MEKKYKFIIFTQNWVPNSNGVKILYNLSDEIEKCGHESYLFIFDNYDISDLPNQYRQKVIKNIDNCDENTVVVFPDTLPYNLSQKILCKNRVWYFLNKPMVLSGNRLNILKNDIIASFSKLIYSSEFQLFYNSKIEGIDEIIQGVNDKKIEKKNQIVIYYGKARKKFRFKIWLLKISLGANISTITRSIPSSKKELLHLLSESRLLVSFDPLTNLNYEATLCGTPVFIADNYAGINYNNYNIPLYGIFENKKQVRTYFEKGIKGEVFQKICQTYYTSVDNHADATCEFIRFVTSQIDNKIYSDNEIDVDRCKFIVDDYQKLKSRKKLINHELSEYMPVFSIKVIYKLLHLFVLSRIINVLLFVFCTICSTNKSLRGKIRKIIRDRKHEILNNYSYSLRS